MAQREIDKTSKNGRQAVEPSRTLSVAELAKRGAARHTTPKRSTSTTKPKPTRQKPVEKPVKEVSKPAKPQPTKPQPKPKEQKAKPIQSKGGQSRQRRELIAMILFMIGALLFLSLFSFLIFWEHDADMATFNNFIMQDNVEVKNWLGRFGAVIGSYVIGDWVGLLGVLFPFYIAMLGVRLLDIRGFSFRHTMASTLCIIFVGSVALGHFFKCDPAVFGSGFGGEGGILAAQSIELVIGQQGTTLFLVFLSIAVLYFANSRIVRRFILMVKRYYANKEQRKVLERQRLRQEAIIRAQQRREFEEMDRAAAAFEEDAPEPEPEPEPIPAPVEPPVVVEEEPAPVEPPVIVEEEPAPVEPPVVEPQPQPLSNIIELEGNQYGYITGYSAAGVASYLYFDRAGMVENIEPVQAVATTAEVEEEEVEEIFTVRDNVVETAPEPEPTPEPEPVPEPQKEEEEDVEFIVERTEEEAVVEPTPIVSAPTVEPIAVKTDGVNFAIEKSGEEETVSAVDINTMPLYDPTADLPNYRKPMVELMCNHTQKVNITKEELDNKKDRIVHTLQTFGIKIDTIKATVGPTVTLYEIIPAPGVRINKIKNLEDDIALSLSALGIRIIAPIPGKGTIGIEVPNSETEIVSMHSVISAAKFQDVKAQLPIALGKTIQNETFVFDLAKMPHLLVAGATGQGKSVGLNAIITSLLYKKHPSELKFVLVDPKKVELTLYSKLEKHFLAKMEGEDEAIITDTQKVVYTLNSLCKEMDSRYDLLKMAEVRNIVEYNDKFIHRRLLPTQGHRYLPYFVVIIDEFADLIMTAGREIETPIARIAQLARAVGIHLIIATQRPTTNIITGVIKANFPARIAFRVTSMIDSRTILDTPGANQLIGRGDMLVSTGSEITRVQCAFIDTPEVDDITRFISSQRGYVSAYELPEYVPESDSGTTKDVDMTRKDPLFSEVARYVVNSQTGSASTIQRKFSIGFNRAGRIVDQLEAAGIVGPPSGSKPRQVLIADPMSLELMLDD